MEAPTGGSASFCGYLEWDWDCKHMSVCSTSMWNDCTKVGVVWTLFARRRMGRSFQVKCAVQCLWHGV